MTMPNNMHGPYGWLIKPIGLAEDEWYLSRDPSDNEDDESTPLYATEHQKLRGEQ